MEDLAAQLAHFLAPRKGGLPRRATQASPAAHDLEPRRCAAIEIDFGAGVKVRIEAGVPKDVIAATLKALR